MEKSITTPDQAILSRILKQSRLGAHLSQAELAEMLEVSQPFVSHYEQGQRRLDLIELRRICHALGLSLLELVRRFEEQAPPCEQTPASEIFRRASGRTSARLAKKSATPSSRSVKKE